MSGRKGMIHRHPREPAIQEPDEDDGDPGLPKCQICDSLGTPANPLIPGLYAYVRRSVQFDICRSCFEFEERQQAARQRMAADPLGVWEQRRW